MLWWTALRLAVLGCTSLDGLVHVQEACRIRISRLLLIVHDCGRISSVRWHWDGAQQHVEELSKDCGVELRKCCRTEFRGRGSVVDVELRVSRLGSVSIEASYKVIRSAVENVHRGSPARQGLRECFSIEPALLGEGCEGQRSVV